MPANKKPTFLAPTDAERRTFGDLAVDVAYLRRGCMLIVAPYHGEFRVGVGRGDDDVVDAEGLQARAQKERNRRAPGQQARALPATPPAPVPSPPAPVLKGVETPTKPAASSQTADASEPTIVVVRACQCGRPGNHRGRCWHRRGWAGPDEGSSAVVPAAAVATPQALTFNQRLTALEHAVAELRRNVWGDKGPRPA